MDELLQKAQAFVLRKRGKDILFGYPHAERVMTNAVYLMQALGGREHTVKMAALLHDVAFDGKNVPTHAPESANAASTFLKEIDYPREERNHIISIIKRHDLRTWDAGGKPQTLEEKIVFDAETMERLSALGFLKFIIVCRNVGYNSTETIKKLKEFVEKNRAAIFFEETRKKADYDYMLVQEMIKRLEREARYSTVKEKII